MNHDKEGEGVKKFQNVDDMIYGEFPPSYSLTYSFRHIIENPERERYIFLGKSDNRDPIHSPFPDDVEQISFHMPPICIDSPDRRERETGREGD